MRTRQNWQYRRQFSLLAAAKDSHTSTQMNTHAVLDLRTANTEVRVAPPRGAIVTSFRVGGREFLYFDSATFDDPTKNVRGGIPVLFPTPGKLENDRWSYGGREGELKQHGFARNLPWRVGASDVASVQLHLESNEATRAVYPWKFAATLIYSVAANTLRIDFSVTNTGDSPMPFAFGLHPYFLVRSKANVRIPTAATRAFDNIAKTIVPFPGFDFTSDEVDLHLIDHGSTRAILDPDGGAQIAIETSPEFIRWVVWTVAGKDYVCLEPWTAPGNALNTGEGILVLAPEETRAVWVTITASN
jgi:galactose mutarotase-like enzyme